MTTAIQAKLHCSKRQRTFSVSWSFKKDIAQYNISRTEYIKLKKESRIIFADGHTVNNTEIYNILSNQK
jgi:hypothetical protein